MKKVDLLDELFTTERRVWFVQRLADLEQTDDMLKARLEIQPDLFVQVYFSEINERLQMALIQGRQRLFAVGAKLTYKCQVAYRIFGGK